MPQEPDDREYTPDESRLKTSFRECIPLFIALGDSTRLAIIQQLYEVEEDRRSLETEQKGGRSVSEKRRAPGLNVKEITEKTSLSRPAVSHHLKILKDSGSSEASGHLKKRPPANEAAGCREAGYWKRPMPEERKMEVCDS